MSDALSLEILIKTIADTRGLTVTTEQIKGLANTMREASAAGKPLETSADVIATALSSAGKATEQLGEASQGTGKTLADLNRAGAGASQILNGLDQAAQGGIQGIFGLAQATRGFITVARTAVASTGPVGILITVLGLAAGAFLALRGRTKEAGDEFSKTKGKVDGANKALATTAENAVATEKKLKELADKGLAEAGEKAKDVEDRFNKAADAIKRTADAAGKVRAAQTDLKLARVDADEASGKLTKSGAESARFNIQRDAAKGDLNAQQSLAASLVRNEQERAAASKDDERRAMAEGLRLAQIQQRLLDRRGQIDDQAGQIREQARGALDRRQTGIDALTKERDSLVLTGDPETDRGVAAKQVDLARKISAGVDARDKEQSQFAGRITPLAKERDSINEELAGLDQSLSEANAGLVAFRDALTKTSAAAAERQAAIQSDIATTTTVAGLADQASLLRKPSANTAARRLDLSQRAEQAQAAGNFVVQGEAVAELRKMDTEARKLSKVLSESAASTSHAFESATKAHEKMKKRLDSTREVSAGN